MRGEYDACANDISKTSVFAPIHRRTGNTRSAALLLSAQCRDVPSKQCAGFQPCVGHVGRALVVSWKGLSCSEYQNGIYQQRGLAAFSAASL